jgi:pyruvate dehydrogenase E2 component (dihydrolipoamide acetyltransferase)
MALIELKVPDIGDFDEVEVIELLVSAGDQIKLEQSLLTVESDKSSMEIPSSAVGRVVELKVGLGDKVAQGSVIALIETAEASAELPAGLPAAAAASVQPTVPMAPATATAVAPDAAARLAAQASTSLEPQPAQLAGLDANSSGAATALRVPPVQADPGEGVSPADLPHASPSVRKFARELGVELSRLAGSGPKQRITADDVRAHVKLAMSGAASKPADKAAGAVDSAGLGLLPWPKVDFAKFGPIEMRPLSRIRKLSAANLHRNWVMIPHVTNHDEADVTALEAFRTEINAEQAVAGVKFTMLAFVIKACVHALQKMPDFNASLEGDSLVLKQYWHIGFAADTPNGLVVPVIRDADRKTISQIAQETATLALAAREGKLAPAQMQGGTFTISSLGGIGGTGFTPIINAPEVAILGLSRTAMRPVWNGSSFEARLLLPLSLSYDHRVIDGAAAARFNAHLARLLLDFRRVLL